VNGGGFYRIYNDYLIDDWVATLPPRGRIGFVLRLLSVLTTNPQAVPDQRPIPDTDDLFVWVPETHVVLTYRIATKPFNAIILKRIDDVDQWSQQFGGGAGAGVP
jgi:hypothetical protein